MTRIDDAFQHAGKQGRAAFMPFVTAGDPDLATTCECLMQLTEAGVDLIEVGFPYSDPIADGPVIQASYTRALDAGVKVDGIMQAIASLKGKTVPLLAMVSYAILFRRGVRSFLQQAADAGFSGFIIPDLPAEEAAEVSATAAELDMDVVQLIAPTTTPERTKQILSQSSGFVYCISVAGTTGTRDTLPVELTEQLRSLRGQTPLPLAVGFGISGPEQVAALDGLADGVIVGSGIVRHLNAPGGSAAAVSAIREFADVMVNAVAHCRPSATSRT